MIKSSLKLEEREEREPTDVEKLWGQRKTRWSKQKIRDRAPNSIAVSASQSGLPINFIVFYFVIFLIHSH